MATSKFARNTPTNVSVAQRIGTTGAMVSFLRSGARHPSNARVRIIEREYGFSSIDQYTAMRDGTYAEKFEKAINGEA